MDWFRFLFISLLTAGFSWLPAQETPDEGVFEYRVGEKNWLTGEGVEPGGWWRPQFYLNAAAGVFEPGGGPAELAASPHDPQNEWGISSVHLHFDFELADDISADVAGLGAQGLHHQWGAELEEAFLRYRLSDSLVLGGGQFLNAFGFQADLHPHDWFFVNQSLLLSRFLNEAHLLTQGGEVQVYGPGGGRLSLGVGGLRSHAHDPEHGHGGDHGHEPGDHTSLPPGEPHLHGLEEAGFQSWIGTADYRFPLPFDEGLSAALSLAVGENGFGRDTAVFGGGLRRVWNGHDHGGMGPEFCGGATLVQAEVVGRRVDARLEDGSTADFGDLGTSTSLHHGLGDRTTVSLRHDWVSAVALAEVPDRHRLSAALTTHLDPEQRLRARLQYDCYPDSSAGTEHAAWFELQWHWGGDGGSHGGHGH